MIRLHCPSYPELDLAGRTRYSDRALVLPGTVVVSGGGEILGYWMWLRSVGIGPHAVITIPPGSDTDAPLLNQLLADQKSCEDLRRCLGVDHDGRVEFFNTTEYEERAMETLGIPWSRVWSASAAVSARANDKCWLRTLARELDCQHLFPRFVIAGAGDVFRALGLLREGGVEQALVKRGDLASGIGVVSVSTALGARDCERLAGFFGKHGKPGRQFLVEERIGDHTPLSVQWEVHGPDDCRRVAASRQVVTRSGEYVGNVAGNDDVSGLRPEDAERMFRDSEPFVRHLAHSGWLGVCGFDFMREESTGKLYLTECNGRVTALTYAIGIVGQVKARLNGQWGIAIGNVFPDAETIRSSEAFFKTIRSDLFDGLKGAIPMNTRCLSLPKPKCIVACVGKTAAAAEEQLAEVRARVSCPLADLS